MKALMKKVWVVTVAVAMVLLFALPCLFGGLSAKGKVPSPRDDENIVDVTKKTEILPYQLDIDKWAISFIFSAPYFAGADSVNIHHFSGEPYPLGWMVSTTRQAHLNGRQTLVVFERDWDHDITRMLWYAGYELGFSVALFKDGEVVWGRDIIVVADCEGITIPEPQSQPTIATQSGVDAVATPEKFELAQNYPNPFNPTTAVEYALPKANEVMLTVYNSNGQTVVTLFKGWQSVGKHRITWNASHNSAGTYFLELRTSEFRKVIKMNLVR